MVIVLEEDVGKRDIKCEVEEVIVLERRRRRPRLRR